MHKKGTKKEQKCTRMQLLEKLRKCAKKREKSEMHPPCTSITLKKIKPWQAASLLPNKGKITSFQTKGRQSGSSQSVQENKKKHDQYVLEKLQVHGCHRCMDNAAVAWMMLRVCG